ncbi:RsmB/NOP family class I SAM-dependent RNA methyltransferase [Patescibacteria group bacterium]|nr:RsmB/NOP family class I SAM-dependent RNA methyltransferase [Patescibacteria group bacterium]
MKESFQEYFRGLIGETEAEKFFEAVKVKETRRSIRVNSLKFSKQELREWLESQGYQVSENPFCGDGLDILGRGEPLSLKLPYYSGLDYPQDSSSMFGVEVLDPQPGETVLDLTAAPGGKTTHIAAKMQNSGVLVANDMDSRRLRALHSNLERLGIWNAVCFRAMPHKLVSFYPEAFDRILLDPSCSGEGLMVTRGGKPDFWSLKALKRYRSEQYGLLKSAFRLLKVGGRLVYSTCTLNDIEDDSVVKSLLEDFPEASLDLVKIADAPEQIGSLLGYRFWPQKTRTKGFFCIAITKKSSMGLERTMDAEHSLRTVKDKKRYENFLGEFGVSLPDVEMVERDEHVFLLSKELASFKLPPKYSLTFPLFKVDREIRFTHAGALWAGLRAKKQVLELTRKQVEAFFERQPIERGSEEVGTYLVRYEGFPLGSAKVTETKIEIGMPRQY